VAPAVVEREREPKSDEGDMDVDMEKSQAGIAQGVAGVAAPSAKARSAPKSHDQGAPASKKRRVETTSTDSVAIPVAIPVAVANPGLDADASASASTRVHPPGPSPAPRPPKPEILDHLVLGINETIKALERQTDDLRWQVMMMGDALAEQGSKRANRGGKDRGEVRKDGLRGQDGMDGPTSHHRPELLPTAPLEVDLNMSATSTQVATLTPVPSDSDPQALRSAHTSSNQHLISPTTRPTQPAPQLTWILLPLGSISPTKLVSPLPQYCATYNTLVYQHAHLAKICRARMSPDQAEDVVGPPREEVRVVPLGKVETETAGMVGLRRLACLGVKVSERLAWLGRTVWHGGGTSACRTASTCYPLPAACCLVWLFASQLPLARPCSRRLAHARGWFAWICDSACIGALRAENTVDPR
jgi:hypothetical protein